MKIGFFDSGLGGLTILQSVTQILPDYDYLYYGDTANLPYGNRSEAEIYKLTTQGVRYLFENECILVIIACNTASAETTRKLQQEFLPIEYPNRKILGVIIPTIENLIFDKPTEVTLIGTKRTVESGKYQLELNQRGNNNTILTQLATPDLVPLIEEGRLSEAISVATSAIKQTPDCKVVVLGCTHYTKLKGELRARFPKINFIAQDEIIPEKIKSYLERHPEIENKLSKNHQRTIHLTAHRPDYDRLTGFFLNGIFVAQ